MSQSIRESHATLVDEELESGLPSPQPVDDYLREQNDVTVLKGQLSSDQIVSDLDVIKTNQLIAEGRAEGRQEDVEEYDEEDDEEINIAQLTKIDAWEVIKRAGVNLFLPFVNGFMLGFGEILAHEVGFYYGWFGAKISPPRRMERKRQQSQYL